MSGATLRFAAKHNDIETVRRLCQEKSNSCSTDEYGLTALHYAVWNGHVECVKYLIMNPRGVTRDRIRTTCHNLQSSVGFSALHLAAMECPRSSCREITTLLLLIGCDVKLVDKNNRTAYALAREVGNDDFIEVFRSYMDVVSGKEDATPYRAIMTKLQKDFNLHPPKPIPPAQEEAKHLIANIADYFAYNQELVRALEKEKSLGHKLNQRGSQLAQKVASAEAIRHQFTVPDRVSEMPSEIAIHEHLILPVAEYGFVHQSDPIMALDTLRFADHQATANAERRRKLMLASGRPFDELEPDYLF